MAHASRLIPAAALTAILASCGGTPTDSGPDPLVLTPVAGTSQQASASTAVPILPAVRVTRGGAPVAGIEVVFTVVSGGGHGGGTAVTDADGVARAGSWVLGTELGEQRMVASIDAPGGATALFSAYAIEIPAAQLSYSPQRDPICCGRAGLPLHEPVYVLLRTVSGTPIAGAPVQWRLLSGSAELEAVDSRTDAGGIARLTSIRFGGNVGIVEVETVVSHPNLTHGAVRWRFEVVAGEAHTIHVLEGQDQVAAAGTVLPIPPLVRLEDFYGNQLFSGGVPGFYVVEGGGSVASAMGTPDFVAGTWRAPDWTLGSQPGRNVLRIEVGSAVIDVVATGT